MVVHDIGSGITFSPEGKRMAYLRMDSPEVGKVQVLTANADGTDEKTLAGMDPARLSWCGRLVA